MEPQPQQPPLGQHFAEIVLELAPDGIAVTDESGHLLHANGRFEDLFGYTRDQLLGHNVEMLLPERVRSIHRDHRSRYERNPARRPMGTGLELWARRADGTEFRVEVALSPVSTERGVRTIMGVREAIDRRAPVPTDRVERVERVVRPLLDAGGELRRLREAVDPEPARRLACVITQIDAAVHELRSFTNGSDRPRPGIDAEAADPAIDLTDRAPQQAGTGAGEAEERGATGR